MATVIIGTGIIGLSTAFYLSQPPSTTPPTSIHLLESSTTLFASASGYAGGFLAADWFDTSSAALGRLSFDLHKSLAEAHDGHAKWGYSRSTSTSWMASQNYTKRGDDWLRAGGSRGDLVGDKKEGMKGSGPKWLEQKEGGRLEIIGEESSTAQVEPGRLCEWLMGRCVERGVKVHQPAQATRVEVGVDGVIEAVVVRSGVDGRETRIACGRIVLTAGAWTPRVFKVLFPQSTTTIPVTSMAGHSIVLRSPRWKDGDDGLPGGGCHSVFSTDEDGFCPEMFSRPGGEIYLAGLNDASLPLPDVVTERKIDQECIRALKKTARRLLGRDVPVGGDGEGMGDLEVVREGLCWRPVTERGTPILSRIDDRKLGAGVKSPMGGGVWTAVGHGPWGISQSLGTGKVMAEMVEGRKTSVDVSGLMLMQDVPAKL